MLPSSAQQRKPLRTLSPLFRCEKWLRYNKSRIKYKAYNSATQLRHYSSTIAGYHKKITALYASFVSTTKKAFAYFVSFVSL